MFGYMGVPLAYTGGFATGTFCGEPDYQEDYIKIRLKYWLLQAGRSRNRSVEERQAGYAVTVLDVKASEYGGSKYLLLWR
jgi:hypothetical protein